MQEVSGSVYNLMLDLERIKFLSQENDLLESDQAEAKEAMKQYLRQWTERVEASVKRMDLPSDVAGELLELTAEAKNLGSMNAIHTIARKVEAILNDVRVAREKEADKIKTEKTNTDSGLDPMAVGAVIGGVALAPFVQVRYTPEAYEEKSKDYVEERLIPRLIRGDYRPVPPNRTYAPPKVSARPKKAQQAEAEIKALEKEIALDFMIEQAQRKGVTLSKADAIRLWDGLGTVAQKHLTKQAKQSLPENSQKKIVLLQKEDEKKRAYDDRMKLNIIKQRKKKERQEGKRLRRVERVRQAEQREAARQKEREEKADAILKAGKVSVCKTRKKSSTRKRTKASTKRPARKELSPDLRKRLERMANASTQKADRAVPKQKWDELGPNELLTKKSVEKQPAKNQDQINQILKNRKDYAMSA